MNELNEFQELLGTEVVDGKLKYFEKQKGSNTYFFLTRTVSGGFEVLTFKRQDISSALKGFRFVIPPKYNGTIPFFERIK